MLPFILSSTSTRLEQNATVTELTLNIDDISHAPAMPSVSLESTVNPSGKAEVKLSIYTFLRKVTNSISNISGVISDIKKLTLSLK